MRTLLISGNLRIIRVYIIDKQGIINDNRPVSQVEKNLYNAYTEYMNDSTIDHHGEKERLNNSEIGVFMNYLKYSLMREKDTIVNACFNEWMKRAIKGN